MAEEGGEEAVVVAVDDEALAQGVTMVARGGALVQVVGNERAAVEEHMLCGGVGEVLLCLLHDAYAPVLVGAIAVAEVIGMAQGIGAQHEE